MFYPDKTVTSLASELADMRRDKEQLLLDLLHLAENIQVPSAAVFLREGVLRRLGTIHRCAENIFDTYPPDRNLLLNQAELADIGIYLQSFLINTYGVLDNLAWVCALNGNFPDPDNYRNRLQIGLFKDAIKPYLPETLLNYLNEGPSKRWFEDYAKKYRDSTAHRIPPYIPPSCVTNADVERLKQLQNDASIALRLHDFEEYERLKAEERGVGSLIPYVVLTLSGNLEAEPPIIMHPQIMCDLMTIHELLKKFAAGMRERYDIEECPLLKLGIL
jgi:hypothetical protein